MNSINDIFQNPKELEKIVRNSVNEGLIQFRELKHSEENIDDAYVIAQTYAIKRFIDEYVGGLN